MQSRTHSIIETVFSTCIGYIISLLTQIIIFPIYDIHIGFSTNIYISAWFTVISLLRGYGVRRFFNYWHSL